MDVTDSKLFEEDEPKTAISARTLMRHNSNQLTGGLGPRMTDNLLIQELLMSKLCKILLTVKLKVSQNNLLF